MDIGIIGLGLIGGSLARAFSKKKNITVWGMDLDTDITHKAVDSGAIEGILTDSKMEICDYIIIALYPQATIDFIKSNFNNFKKNAVIMDTCGVKEIVCSEIFPFAKEKGFIFIGTHPMAGIEKSGFDNSFAELFRDASIILVPDSKNDNHMERTKALFKSIGFGRIEVTTGIDHDKMIAYTSQLAHVVSSAYVKNPFALRHKGFSAGSFHDMTRVARLNEGMWTELFLDNREYLVDDIDSLIEELTKYRDCIGEADREKLLMMLAEGRKIREGLSDDDNN